MNIDEYNNLPINVKLRNANSAIRLLVLTNLITLLFLIFKLL